MQVRVYIDTLQNWPEFNTGPTAWAGTRCPSRAVVPTGPLHHGFKLEVQAIALTD